MLVKQLLTFGCLVQIGFCFARKSSQSSSPPQVFWQFTSNPQRGRSQTISDEGYPQFLLSYYDAKNLDRSSTSMGTYRRDNPIVWSGNSNNIRLGEKKEEVLALGKRLKLSHGPRRKRQNSKSSLNGKLSGKTVNIIHVPLFCWRLLFNCTKTPLNICCPVGRQNDETESGNNSKIASSNDDTFVVSNSKTFSENQNKNVKSRRSLREDEIVYLDPLFKIPVVRKVPFLAENKSKKVVSQEKLKTNITKVIENSLSFEIQKPFQQQQHHNHHQQQQQQIQQQQEVQQHQQQQQRWRPYSFNNVVSQRRCRMFSEDCSVESDHPCCQFHRPIEDHKNIDRFYPIGPYVQTSLLENWMSAVFEHFGQNPVSFVIAKNVILVLLFGGITLAWGMLGQRLGVFQRSVQAKADPQQRIDENVIEEATDKITFAINQAEDWMDKLEEGLAAQRAFKGINQVLCCFIPDHPAKSEPRMKGGKLECAPKSDKSKNKKSESTVECVSNLLYSIRINNKKTK